MNELFSVSFWFNARPDVMTTAGFRTYLAVLLLLLAVAVVAGILKKRKKGPYTRVLGKLQPFGWLNLMIGLLYLLFRQELIPYLSARVVVLVWLAGVVVWLGFIGKEARKIPSIRERKRREQEYKKYIPG